MLSTKSLNYKVIITRPFVASRNSVKKILSAGIYAKSIPVTRIAYKKVDENMFIDQIISSKYIMFTSKNETSFAFNIISKHDITLKNKAFLVVGEQSANFIGSKVTRSAILTFPSRKVLLQNITNSLKDSLLTFNIHELLPDISAKQEIMKEISSSHNIIFPIYSKKSARILASILKTVKSQYNVPMIRVVLITDGLKEKLNEMNEKL